jgi:hypothetical protein
MTQNCIFPTDKQRSLVGRVDFLRRRVLVSESVTPVKGVMTFGPTKGHERREVPLPRFLVG